MRQLIVALALAGPLPAGAETGAQIYRDGGEGTATLAGGQVTTPASRFPCAGCHGQTAGGRVEGAIKAPPITWPALAAADRPGGSYDIAAFARLLREGIRPDGSTILSVMPRYDLDDAQIAALASFLQAANTEASSGITAATVFLPRPDVPDFADGLGAAVEAFNRAGGAYGRTLAIESGTSGAVSEAVLYDRIEAAIVEAEEIALIAALTASGVEAVELPDDDRDLAYRLGQAGIAVRSEEAVILAVAKPSRAPEGKTVYVSHSVLRTSDPSRLSLAEDLFVALPDDGEVRQFLAAGRSGRFIDGYVAGRAIGLALRDAGRRITADEVSSASASAAASLRISVVEATRILAEDQ
jgi:mono/diheme cytochrome c family protein